MEQTLKYIRVLNWGYSSFAPMTLNNDYEKSIQQANERLELLESLDEDALLFEATGASGKANLQRFMNAGTDFDHGLRFMRDRKILLDSIPTMYVAFKDGADKLRDEGLWTNEQWREYRVTLSEIEQLLKERLTQFAAAYDYIEEYDLQEGERSISQTVNNENNKSDIPHDILRLFGSKAKYDEFINACIGHCPKEIARLYKYEYGKIQLHQEKGVVTLLYNHLSSIGILNCSKSNFQIHYRSL